LPVVEAATKAPIVLFHDSLGCVGLWRDFPEALSVATGRRVIAYDRLGFGRSDARATLPSLDFIAEEASLSFPVMRRALRIERFVVAGATALVGAWRATLPLGHPTPARHW
jgi:pimeloyl-ACP methyl ester carboxylesterase